MEILRFKSNIKCSGCLKKVEPYLNDTEHILNWNVALESTDKILTVVGKDALTANSINNAVEKAGYKVEQIKK